MNPAPQESFGDVLREELTSRGSPRFLLLESRGAFKTIEVEGLLHLGRQTSGGVLLASSDAPPLTELLVERRPRDAITALDAVLERRPGLARARLERAVLLTQEGERARALEDLDLLVETHPELASALFCRGMLLAGMGRFEQAKADLAEFLRAAPENPNAPQAREQLQQLGG